VLPARDALFDSAWLKWGNGVVHAQAMGAEIDALGSEPHHMTLRCEFDAERQGFAVIVERLEPDLRPRLGLRMGDVASNFRSALDNLAWALVSRGTAPPAKLPEPQRRRISFPICKGVREFDSSIKTKLPGVAQADVAVVRRYQPYHARPGRQRLQCLSVLHDLDGRNDHRVVQPVWWCPEEVALQLSDVRDCRIVGTDARAERRLLRVGTELAFVPVLDVGSDPHVHVEAQVPTFPAIDDLSPLAEWLTKCIGWICNLLAEFSEVPPELFTLGIDWGRLGGARRS
jgi:hypothetical protein